MNNRLAELDILRGLSVFGMILVVNPGNWGYQFQWMQHAEWQGFPLADMIFPTFLFCVGVSMALSFSRKIENGDTLGSLFKSSLIRSLLMILIGLFINAFPYFDWQHMRIPGVIQRIGICYLIVSSIYLIILLTQAKSKVFWLAVTAVVILTGYFIVLYYIPIHSSGITKIGNINLWPPIVDQYLFGINHIWPYGQINGEVPYDPDGLLASLPACVNVIFGLVVGEIIKGYANHYTFKQLLLSALALMLIGFLLNYFGVMPMIKKLWTSSFVLYSTGFSLLILAVVKWIIEHLRNGLKVFYPFRVFGSNALLAFVGCYLMMSLMDRSFENGTSIRQVGFSFFQHISADLEWASFLYSLVPLVVYYMGLHVLYKRRWLLKL